MLIIVRNIAGLKTFVTAGRQVFLDFKITSNLKIKYGKLMLLNYFKVLCAVLVTNNVILCTELCAV